MIDCLGFRRPITALLLVWSCPQGTTSQTLTADFLRLLPKGAEVAAAAAKPMAVKKAAAVGIAAAAVAPFAAPASPVAAAGDGPFMFEGELWVSPDSEMIKVAKEMNDLDKVAISEQEAKIRASEKRIRGLKALLYERNCGREGEKDEGK